MFVACPPPVTSSSGLLPSEDMLPPEDEVAAYAEDLTAIDELGDMPDDELFSWSDFEDEGGTAKLPSRQDDDMCIS